jgi:DNA-binding transcriptional ArsR family regulator
LIKLLNALEVSAVNALNPYLNTATVYDALADPTRRELLVDLAGSSPKTATQLSTHYTHITRQGLLRHLTVLKAAGLVTVRQHGREKRFELSPAPLGELEDFVHGLHTTWDKRGGRLRAFVENE